ncbi:MAG: pyridoxamine 5'-phosphate oxidase family protein [Cellulosilyticum sp.]|nr:pyridoxamine 5'-phosphate oxidase family protein [Cellulosilyticum sp.]
MKLQEVLKILEKQTLMSVATYGQQYPDNSIVCFAHSKEAELYFGSYSDTLKCKNIDNNPIVAVTVGTLQIHGEAKKIPYGTTGYMMGRGIYDAKFPQYKSVFELENNELYVIIPYVIWNYNPSKGEMHRDVLILNESYYQSIEVYRPHNYIKRIL